MDLGAWLRDLGLGKYEVAFRESEIDEDVLPELSEADLEKLGIPLGTRKKLLRAIAALARTPAGTRAPSGRSIASEAERRQLTLMFIDLVGSTALSAKLDPEDMHDLIRVYQNACDGVIARFEGHVAKYMGDGVLAYFGWPRAHEDEAERAVRAGMGIVQAVRELTAPGGVPLEVRIGIATGPVVVGELVGTGAAKEEAVVGDTPNLAARLQMLAEPNSVVISRRTRRLIGGLFKCVDLGAHLLKGFEAPVQAWRVVGEDAAEGRFEALRGTSLTPLVGREEELQLLLNRWEQAKKGTGQVILLGGEAGIGKSRITHALQQRFAEESYTRLLYFCSPYHQNSALHPVIEQLQRAANFAHADEEQKLDRLAQLLVQSTDAAEAIPLLAALLSLPPSDHYPLVDLEAQEQKARTLGVLVGHLEALTRRHPVLLVFEDVHWIDPTSFELLESIIERVRTLAALMIITFRPEFKPAWLGRPHVTALWLKRLSRKQGATLVERVAAGKALPAEVLTEIVDKTDGIPLFTEELTKTVLESGLLRDEGGRYALPGVIPAFAIPATLRDSLTARLDRLISAKEVAQIGAVIGRQFPYELLAAISPLGENELHEALAELEDSELVFRSGEPPNATFTFKHALVRDAAYGSLLRRKRQGIHGRIANVLKERFQDTATRQPEVIAHHYTEAGIVEQAVPYWLKAGQRAAQRSANVEAVSHLTKGLDVLKTLSASAAWRAELELELQAALVVPVMTTEGYASQATGAALVRARELCERLERTDRLLPILYGQWAYHIVGGEHRTARQHANQFLDLARARADPAAELIGHRILGVSLFHLAEIPAARAHHEEALALYDPQRHRSLAFQLGHDQRASTLSFLSLELWLSGYPDRASLEMERALDFVEELNHANSRAFVLVWGAALLAALRRDAVAAGDYARTAISLSREHGSRLFLATGHVFRSWASAQLGGKAEQVAELINALAECEQTRTRVHRPFHLGLLAEVLQRRGRTDEGLRAVTEALSLVEATEERVWEAELQRCKGDLMLSREMASAGEAETCYRLAISAARRQGTKSLELRASASLARLWQAQGRNAEAQDLLAPIHGWFTEGFATADLKETKALLDDLG